MKYYRNILPTLLIGLSLCSFGYVSANESTTPYSKAHLVLDDQFPSSGSQIGVYVQLEQGWHTYWENAGESGSPSEIVFESSSKLIDQPTRFTIPKKFDEQGLITFGFSGETLFVKTLQWKDIPDKSQNLLVTVQYLVCKDICVPARQTWTVGLSNEQAKIYRDPKMFSKFSFPDSRKDIEISYESTSSEHILNITHPQSLRIQDFFPSSSMPDDFIRPYQFRSGDLRSQIRYKKNHTTEFTQKVLGVLTYSANGRTLATSFDPEPKKLADDQASQNKLSTHEGANTSLLFLILFAFLGGLILNLMPCVFPVLSIKVLHLLGQEKPQDMLRSNLWYSAGVIFSFLCLAGVLSGLKALGHQLGWGFQLQSVGFVYFLLVLFFVIGLNLLGLFEIQVPSLSYRSSKESGPLADFMVGVLTTIVASPCTAPFMGVAIGVALSKSIFIMFVVFFFLGLGLSLPYLMVALLPQLLGFLPKPGKWMETFKQFMAFPMFFTCIWLLWLLTRLSSIFGIVFALSGCVAIAFGLWLRNQVESKVLRRLILSMVACVLVALGYATASLQGLEKNPSAQGEKSSGIDWLPFSLADIEKFQKENKLVFINFTADWCLTCKANEKLVFQNQRIIRAFAEPNVIAMKADWTHSDPEITQMLQSFDRAGVPFYLLYKPSLTKPLVLPTLLRKDSLLRMLSQGEHSTSPDKGDLNEPLKN